MKSKYDPYPHSGQYGGPKQTLLDGTIVYHAEFPNKLTVLLYLDAGKKTPPKMVTREEFRKLGGLIGLYE